MDAIFYEATTAWVLFVDLMVVLATVWLFRIGKATRQQQWILGVGLGGFVFLLHWVFGGQRIFAADLSGSAFYLLILVGAALGAALLYILSSGVRDQLSQKHLQLAQGLRVFIGGGFLMEGVLQVIPGWFSIMDGFFHIASGFFALVAAVAFLKQLPASRKLLWLANIVGLLDIIVIVNSICFLVWDDLGPFHNMNYVVFGVGPILLWLHFVSIKKLIASPKVALT